jgi:hypothetical protein
VSVECRQIDVTATCRSLLQSSPTDYACVSWSQNKSNRNYIPTISRLKKVKGKKEGKKKERKKEISRSKGETC